MAGSKMKISGNKLKLVASMAENPLLGNLIKAKMMKQMGLDKLWKASIAEDEAPFLVPGILNGRGPDGDGGKAS